MRRLLSLIVPLFLLAGAPVAARGQPAEMPVIDLRLGLASGIAADSSLAHGVGQGGYVELARGNEIGSVLPFPTYAEGSPRPSGGATSAFFALKKSLDLSQKFELVGCARRDDRIATWFELEAPDELALDPAAVGLWVTRGVRVFAIASEHDNALATSATGIAPGPVTGLTRVGREIVRQVLAAGALVDVSNASDPSIDDMIELARMAQAPLMASHSNARALADNPKNLSDTQIREIAASGGLIGATAEYGLLAPGRPARLEHLVRQILHLVRVAGPEHVALGIGFEAGVSPLLDFKSPADFPRLARALRIAGLSQKDVARVFHENAERVLCGRHSEPAPKHGRETIHAL